MKIRDLEVTRHRLEKPLSIAAEPGTETYIHPLVGNGLIHFEGQERSYELGERQSVFSAPSSGVLSAGHGMKIAPNGCFDILVVSVGGMAGRFCEPIWIEPKRHEIGYGNHKRAVYEILGGDGPAVRLRCGETVNEKGGWSSWPPHSFDMEPSNSKAFEEIFVPFLRPRNGSAVMLRQGTFCDGSEVSDAVRLHSGEMVSVPLGYHPIAGGPETDLMYFWAYVSPEPKKYSKWAEDVGAYA